MVRFSFRCLFSLAFCLILTGFGIAQNTGKAKPPTLAEAKVFIEEAEARLMALSVDASRASWVQSTHITEDTEILAAQANERAIAAGVNFAKRATRFDGLKLPSDLARKMKLLKLSLTLAAPFIRTYDGRRDVRTSSTPIRC